MLAIKVASWCDWQAESAKQGRVDFPDIAAPPGVASRGNPSRADRDRVTNRAAKFAPPKRVERRVEQYDVFPAHESTSLLRDRIREFNDR
jgi:hypothetical protein